MAEALVAIPFSVPRVRRLLALLVSRMVEVGNANVPATPRRTINTAMTPNREAGVGKSAVNGIRRNMIGNIRKAVRRHRRTPTFRAIGGKRTS
jgi:hypothetical protein